MILEHTNGWLWNLVDRRYWTGEGGRSFVAYGVVDDYGSIAPLPVEQWPLYDISFKASA